jgi:hypothetical protein
VELEKDLSIKRQFLDVAIVRKTDGVLAERLPDGLDNLTEHNLITYKSLREPLDDWALKELTGHYVNYRKQVVQAGSEELLPEGAFGLYGVATRFPSKLSGQVSLNAVQKGVYETRRATDRIRVIVLGEIPKEEHNALWHLFSGIEERVAWGALSLTGSTPAT